MALLILAALVVLLILLLGGDDKSTKDVPGTTGRATGTLTANGTALRGSAPGSLSGAIGQPARGTALRVLSVIPGSGFWVGSSNRDRVFVEWGSAAGADENQGFTPKVGQEVNLTGPVRRAPADPAKTLHIKGADAALVAREGAYVNADRVLASR